MNPPRDQGGDLPLITHGKRSDIDSVSARRKHLNSNIDGRTLFRGSSDPVTMAVRLPSRSEARLEGCPMARGVLSH